MKFVVLTATSKLPAWLDDVIADYSKKSSYWIDLQLKNVNTKSSDRDDKESKIKFETEKFLNALEPSDFVVLCDEKGKSIDSLGFGKQLERILGSGKKRTVFIIGGAYGVGPEIKKRADWTWSFSAMTFNHHVAIAVLFEQIYRGLTIIKGVKYHNA